MRRVSLCPETGWKRGAWTPEEDELLTTYITRYGIWNWREIPKFAGLSRCGKSCRLRWLNYLRPNIKRGSFTPEEDEVIIKAHEKLGNRWSRIAASLPGRTDNEIKYHWHAHLSKREKENTKSKRVKGELLQYETHQKTESVPNSIQSAVIESLDESSYGPSSMSSSTVVFGDSTTSITESNINDENILLSEEVSGLDSSFWNELYVPGDPLEQFAPSPLSDYVLFDGYDMDTFFIN